MTGATLLGWNIYFTDGKGHPSEYFFTSLDSTILNSDYFARLATEEIASHTAASPDHPLTEVQALSHRNLKITSTCHMSRFPAW